MGMMMGRRHLRMRLRRLRRRLAVHQMMMKKKANVAMAAMGPKKYKFIVRFKKPTANEAQVRQRFQNLIGFYQADKRNNREWIIFIETAQSAEQMKMRLESFPDVASVIYSGTVM